MAEFHEVECPERIGREAGCGRSASASRKNFVIGDHRGPQGPYRSLWGPYPYGGSHSTGVTPCLFLLFLLVLLLLLVPLGPVFLSILLLLLVLFLLLVRWSIMEAVVVMRSSYFGLHSSN